MDHSNPPSDPARPREEALFTAALERPLTDRVAFLDGACHGDAALRARLEALLVAQCPPALHLRAFAIVEAELRPVRPPHALEATAVGIAPHSVA